MTNTFYTSDTHFYHQALLDKEYRSFSSIDEMNETIISRWNDTVKPLDDVWHCGDVVMGNVKGNLPILSRLNGILHLVAGNHDSVWSGHRNAHTHLKLWSQYFVSVQSFARHRVERNNFLVSHFPYSGDHTYEERFNQYRLRDEGLPLVHGHVHSEWKSRGQQLNVGVDVWDFRPVALDEISSWIRSL